MGAETSVVVSLLFIGFLLVAIATYSTGTYSKNLVKNAQDDQDTMKKAKMQTDITIINITKSTSRLNISLQNTGKTTLNASAMDVFVNGVFYNYNLTSSGKTWPSENNTNITIFPITYSAGDRVKIVSENGISDYSIVP